MTNVKHRLYVTNVQLSYELFNIHSSLTIYKIIGLNAKAIHDARPFLAFVQNQSLSEVALGFSKVFERENNHNRLCSIRGVYQLAKTVQIQDKDVATVFVKRYGVLPTDEWVHDVEHVLSRYRPKIKNLMQKIDPVRNTRLAHNQQSPSEATLPSIAMFEESLAFAFDFYSFINWAFLDLCYSYPILHNKQIESSLLHLLKTLGVNNPLSDFPDRQ